MKPILQLLLLFYILNSCSTVFGQGTLDSTFGNGGKVVTAVGDQTADLASSATLEADGKILVAGGEYTQYLVPQYELVRYKTNGTLDSSFGSNGKIIDRIDSSHYYSNSFISIAVQPDQKIVLTTQLGITDGSGDIQFYYIGVARYKTNGHLDSSFGINGKEIIEHEISALIPKTILTPDNKIILAGLAYDSNEEALTVIQLNSDGTLDSLFGENGIATNIITYNPPTYLNSMALQVDGKLVFGGSTFNEINRNYYDYILIRCKSSGKIDSTFGSDGQVITPYSNEDTYPNGIRSIAIQPDKRIVVTGDKSTSSTSSFSLARYLENGTLDSAFGENGIVVTNIKGKQASSYDLALENDGKIVVTGTIIISGATGNFELAKYNSNGKIDSSFGVNGLVETKFNDNSASTLVLLQADNKIVQIGTVGFADFALARLNNNAILAITLAYFSATKKQSSVLLSWQTLHEENNSYFTVERRANANDNYEEIGKIYSKANSGILRQYTFEDINPLTGNNFYCLKQTDNDGKLSYSTVKFINFDFPVSINIFPNPANDFFTITGLSSNSKTTILIINIKGQVVSEANTINSTYNYPIKTLSAGVYYVRIMSDRINKTVSFLKK